MSEAISATFERNLQALGRHEPALAERLRAVEPAQLQWQEARDGGLTARLETADGRGTWLASRYDPRAEAEQRLGDVDYQQTACLVLLGYGLGHHVELAAERLLKQGVLIVFEPDLGQLRAVLERVDHSRWLGQERLILADGETDAARLSARLDAYASVITQGTRLITHPPTRQRHSQAVQEFSNRLTDVLAYCRTAVATALVNSARTIHNLMCNLDCYAAGPTTEPLLDAAKGYPAVCVSAGPSLAHNIDLLRDPGVRRNIVLITAQTTLGPLLDRGIKPDFVTALDYSQISSRFYENLPPLPDVTLVAEAKAHPSVIDAFPGPVRMIRSGFNDKLLEDLAPPRTSIPDGTTVAHLSFYLAQHLGCDPIILIGQDLGFSKGLYYAPGTAAHRVWAGELNAFNSLEMMEWRRIVRHRNQLKPMQDTHGQAMYADEQMLTYLRQFERDFASAPQRIIDATEGGAPKAHSEALPLAEALRAHATRPVPALPQAARELDADRLDALLERLRQRRQEIAQLKAMSGRTLSLLEKMKAHQDDRRRLAKWFEEVDANRKRIDGDLKRAFWVVNTLNTLGTYKRSRADRAIANQQADARQRQNAQLDRDIENVDWLIQACEESLDIFDAALPRIEQARRRENELAEVA